MSLVAYALTTVARFKVYAGISGSSDDAIIESIINSVTDFVERKTQRRFKKTNYTAELHDGENSNIILLKEYPVISSPAVILYERDSSINQNTWDTINAEDYFVDYEEGIIRAQFHFARGIQNYKVNYWAGYDIDTANKTLDLVGLSDLELLVWELSKIFYLKRKTDTTIKQLRLGDRSIVYDRIISENDHLQSIVDKFIRYV